ncbi:LysR family transcriptional regulator [Acinetobacter sp. ANC 4558]|uniref:LysR family transcriptional regulator n=1 Tax=Acinetobacter sp. ANC 4558 TaxID=1977876 RepID=UPI000A357C48|nr:LysR family transcriptional regulator [Acinetobacter sp. ANC 4558]OTG86454.1 LysR family transcriptional regulator [Acinetobacter sp. ANC 4558]
MQIKSLEVFLMVVKLGSFSEAAKYLHTVQSNVTSHIKKLETELGVEILHRQTPILPTRAGLQLYDYAEKIVSLQKEVVATFSHTQMSKSFPLNVGSMETTAAVRLPILFQHLQQMEPIFPFSLTTGTSRDLIDQVRTSQLDCAFIASSVPIEGLFNYHVWTEQLVLISSQHVPHPLTKEFLSQKKFIAFKQGCSYRKTIDLFLSLNDLPATNILEMGSLDGIVSCVSLDVGVAILPISYVQQSHFYERVIVHELDHRIPEIKTYLIADVPANWGTNMTHFLENLKLMMHDLHSEPSQQNPIEVT